MSQGLEFSGVIPISECQLTFSGASGPGGQNVNKVHTKVDLRFKLADAKWLSPEVKDRLKVRKRKHFVSCLKIFLKVQIVLILS